MNKHKKLLTAKGQVIFLGIIIGGLYWLVESVIHIVILNNSFIEGLFPSSLHELWMRSLITCMFIGFGIYAQIVITKLRKSRNFLQTLIDGIPDIVMVIDFDHRIALANRAARKIAKGIEPIASCLRCYQISHHRDIPCEGLEHPCPLEQVIATQKPVAVMHTHYDPEGNKIFIEVSAAPIFNKAGKVIQIIESCRDITELKQLDEALRKSEEKYRSLIANIPDVTWTTDHNGRTTFISSNVEKVYGYLPEEIFEKGEQLWFGRIHPDDIDSVKKAFAAVFEKGVRLDIEYRIRRKDGEWIWLSDRSIGAYEKDGVKYADGVFCDITVRKQAEEEMQKLATVVRHSSALVNLATLDGKMIFLNEAGSKMLGIDPDEVEQANIMQVIPDHLKQLVKTELLPTLKDSRTWEGELQYLNLKTNKLTDIHAITFTVQDPLTSKPLYLANVSYDITNRKKSEEKVLIYQKNLRSLAAKLTSAEERQRRKIASNLHDNVSQSLALALNQLRSLCKSGEADDSKAFEEICRPIEDAIQNVRDLTFDLGSPTLYKFGLESAINELLNERLRNQHGIVCNFVDDKEDKPLDDDVRVLLFQAVRELLINVTKHAKAQKVEVAIQRQNSNIRISVSDDGIGFDTEKAEISIRRGGGFGIFNIRERLDYIGGKFTMDSQPGNGSRFVLTAPMKTETALPGEQCNGD